jgi:uncharacterized protein YdeI (YjbR/CyaY-like superfamily)
MNPKVDEYLGKAKKWQDELVKLREIVLDCQLVEELKWKVPCYTINGKNIVLIHAFKEYCALLFMKGSLLNDSKNILFQQTDNVQSGRQIRFTNIQEIIDLEADLKAYIFEAIEVEKAGLKVEYKKTEDFEMPEEFQIVLNENQAVKSAFEALTPGRQKGYLLHFSGAKQSATRCSRIENSIDRILKGKGLNDCTCGLSKRMPNCDGSHKQLNNH